MGVAGSGCQVKCAAVGVSRGGCGSECGSVCGSEWVCQVEGVVVSGCVK